MIVDCRDWTPAERDLCSDRCALYGEPACWRLADLGELHPDDDTGPCDDCRAGVPAVE